MTGGLGPAARPRPPAGPRAPREEFEADDLAWVAAGGRPRPQEDGPSADEPCPENLQLMIHGRLALDVAIRRWWGRWRLRASATNKASIGQQLRAVARGGPAVALSEHALGWIRAQRWVADELSAAEAGRWLAVWTHDAQARRPGGSLGGHAIGRPARRQRPPEWLRLGRKWYKPQQ